MLGRLCRRLLVHPVELARRGVAGSATAAIADNDGARGGTAAAAAAAAAETVAPAGPCPTVGHVFEELDHSIVGPYTPVGRYSYICEPQSSACGMTRRQCYLAAGDQEALGAAIRDGGRQGIKLRRRARSSHLPEAAQGSGRQVPVSARCGGAGACEWGEGSKVSLNCFALHCIEIQMLPPKPAAVSQSVGAGSYRAPAGRP